MSGMVFKVKHHRNFTTVGNAWINNPELSAKAKGILLYLLSKPHDWEANLEDIAAHMLDGIDSIKSGLKELKRARHIVKASIRDEDGKISGWETLVFEEPLPEVENPLSGFSTNWITHKWKIHHVENPPQLNTKDIYLSTDLDTEELNTEQKPNTEETKAQNRSAAIAGGSILAVEAGRGLGELKPMTGQTGENSGEEPKGTTERLASQKGSEKTSESRKFSKKKKKEKPREYSYLRLFRNDEAMQQDFVALYAAHPKHTCAREAAEAYYRLRKAGVTSEEIMTAHQKALEGAWRGRAIQLYPKLADWLSDELANRDLGIKIDRPALPATTVEKNQRYASEPWGNYADPNPEFLAYLQYVHLPSLACYKEQAVSIYQAESWLVAARHDERRRDLALIQYRAFLEWKQQKAVTAGDRPAQYPEIAAPSGMKAVIASDGRIYFECTGNPYEVPKPTAEQLERSSAAREEALRIIQVSNRRHQEQRAAYRGVAANA